MVKMARPGRKRKAGPREPNGRLKRIHDAARDTLIVEKLAVLRQPHRLGNILQECESPLGRFVLRNCLDKDGKPIRAIYDAGIEYGGMVRHFYAAKGIPAIVSEGTGSGAGVSPEKAKKLGEELARIEPPLKSLSRPGFSAVRMLCVHEREILPGAEYWAIEVLFLLAQLLRKLGNRP